MTRHPSIIAVHMKASDKKVGLTLDELASWVQRAYEENVSGSAKVRVSVGFRSQILTIETEE